MNNSWPTQIEDMQASRLIIGSYAYGRQLSQIPLFDWVLNRKRKKMEFRMASWVVELAKHFYEKYGAEHGDYVIRQVITYYLIQGKTRH